MSKERFRAAPLTAAMGRYALLWLRLGTLFLYVLFHVVLGDFPSLVRIVFVHALECLQRVESKIFFIHDTVWANDKCHDSSHPIFSRGSGEGEPADHCTANYKVHLSHRRRRSLPFQHLKVVAVIRLRLTRNRIALLQRLGDFFSNRTSPRPIRVLPRQAIMFPR